MNSTSATWLVFTSLIARMQTRLGETGALLCKVLCGRFHKWTTDFSPNQR